MKKYTLIGSLALSSILLLGACNNDEEVNEPEENAQQEDHSDMDHSGMDHSEMDHSSDGSIPEGLEEAENPTYEVGSKAKIQNAHMDEMEGVEATIVGAFDTTAYVITYTPTSGGPEVKDHKWVVQEELLNAPEAPIEPGTEVEINTDHMEGMMGATGVIEAAEETTVYMVDYTTTDGKEVKNHKWVTQEELTDL
ncbi:YdhK family protein [Mangrovibacillus cuniculi]|uniref:YdhK family protein n=1 Tax=Mangrovibacillus cuniculi TaxID=2593652 RepID=A0A7S8HEB5_9BACI|nr:YdhK family protein [Mangrovibacillus cuniculi]QPC45664.1 YdhK family protein [Mangrovibacillus cuniculi]